MLNLFAQRLGTEGGNEDSASIVQTRSDALETWPSRIVPSAGRKQNSALLFDERKKRFREFYLVITCHRARFEMLSVAGGANERSANFYLAGLIGWQLSEDEATNIDNALADTLR